MSFNVSDKNELQILQNNGLRICYNVRLRDMVSIERMHNLAHLLSLDQRRQKQVLFLMFIHKNRHVEACRIHPTNTRAANVYSFVREKYNNVKYKNSSYYKGSLLWDTLPASTRLCLDITDFRNSLKRIYSNYNSKIWWHALCFPNCINWMWINEYIWDCDVMKEMQLIWLKLQRLILILILLLLLCTCRKIRGLPWSVSLWN